MADPVQPGFTGFIFFFKILSSALRIQCYLQTAKFQQYSSYIVATFQLHFSYISLFFKIPILSSASRIQFYLQTSPDVFVQIADYICQNCRLHLSKLQIISVKIANCICPNSQFWAVRQESSFICWQAQVYLSKLQIVSVKIANCICTNSQFWAVR